MNRVWPPQFAVFSKDDPAPDKLLLGLIGAGIQRSRTPALHEREAAQHGLHCFYQLIDLETLELSAGVLPELITAAERMGFAGLNITHPCKQAVLPLLHEISEDARALGAVNTVVLRNGRRRGANTDWSGFHEALRSGLPDAARGRVVQLGAGGGGSATAYAALKSGVERLEIADTSADRAAALVERLNAVFEGSRAVMATSVKAAFETLPDGVIHATPTGMYGHDGMPLDPRFLRPPLWVADIVYFPLETELLHTARAAGCRTLDGGRMVVEQAAAAFRLFTDLKPDRSRMHAHFVSMTESAR